jgi:hypothetical protein
MAEVLIDTLSRPSSISQAKFAGYEMTGMRQAGFGIILAVTLLSGRGGQASGAPLGAVLDSQGAQFNVGAAGPRDGPDGNRTKPSADCAQG